MSDKKPEIKTEVKNKYAIAEEVLINQDMAENISEFIQSFKPDFPINWNRKNKITIDIYFDKETHKQTLDIYIQDEEVKLIPLKNLQQIAMDFEEITSIEAEHLN